jgi:hypothetical protein
MIIPPPNIRHHAVFGLPGDEQTVIDNHFRDAGMGRGFFG